MERSHASSFGISVGLPAVVAGALLRAATRHKMAAVVAVGIGAAAALDVAVKSGL